MRHFAVDPEYRSVRFLSGRERLFLPGDRNNNRDASHSSAVLEEHGIPDPAHATDDPALRDAGIPKSHIIVKNISACKFSLERIRREARFHPSPAVLQRMDHEEIVTTFYLIKMRTLVAQRSFRRVFHDQPVKASFLRTGHLFVQLCQVHLAVPVYDIDPVVVIEQKRAVVVESFDLALSPRAFDLLRPEEVSLPCIVTDKYDIESTLMVTETCRPHALAVDVFVIREFLRIGAVEMIENIRRMLPVKKVIRAQDLPARQKMHRGGDHVVDPVDEDHVGVGKIHPEDRVASGDRLTHMAYRPFRITIGIGGQLLRFTNGISTTV